MANKRIKFTFVQELIKEPIIWKLAKQFDVDHEHPARRRHR